MLRPIRAPVEGHGGPAAGLLEVQRPLERPRPRARGRAAGTPSPCRRTAAGRRPRRTRRAPARTARLAPAGCRGSGRAPGSPPFSWPSSLSLGGAGWGAGRRGGGVADLPAGVEQDRLRRRLGLGRGAGRGHAEARGERAENHPDPACRARHWTDVTLPAAHGCGGRARGIPDEQRSHNGWRWIPPASESSASCWRSRLPCCWQGR